MPELIDDRNNNPYYQAHNALKSRDFKKAENILSNLLGQDMENCVLLFATGMVYLSQHKNGVAQSLISRAMERINTSKECFKRLGVIPKENDEPAFRSFLARQKAEMYNALGVCYKQENQHAKAREFFEKADKLIPEDPDVLNNFGTLHINEGNPADALPFFERALAKDPQNKQAHWNKSLANLELGNYREGWLDYEWGDQAFVRQNRFYDPEKKIPSWDGTKNQTIVVFGEQGLGDEILFSSCIPDLIQDSKEVIFDCHKRLKSIFERSFGIRCYGTREDDQIDWPCNHQIDARIAVGSLPKFYRNELSAFPKRERYLSADSDRMRFYRDKLDALGNKPKIGISWIGGHKRTRVEIRSMFLDQMMPILKNDAYFVSLQYTPECGKEIEQVNRDFNLGIQFWPEATHAEDYMETAALVSELDLVISVCTSVVHLAGALGKPCWVLTPNRPAWRYGLEGDTMPWYSGVVLYRQSKEDKDWTKTIEEVASDLKYLLEPPKAENVIEYVKLPEGAILTDTRRVAAC